MSHTVKLFERIINHMLRTIVELGNIHSVFRRGRSTMDPALRTLTHRSGISVIGMVLHIKSIGLYRDVWIAAIASSTTSLATRTAAICVRFQGRRVRRVYVTMQIAFLTRKAALIYRRGLRQRVASLTLNCNGDFAIRAYGD